MRAEGTAGAREKILTLECYWKTAEYTPDEFRAR